MAPITRNQFKKDLQVSSENNAFCGTNDEMDYDYNFNYPRRQLFPFRQTFLTYIFKNKTPQAYRNLTLTCKLFFAKEKVLVVDKIYTQSVKGYGEYYLRDEVSLDKIKVKKTKLWFTKTLGKYFRPENFYSELSNCLYRYDGTLLDFTKHKLYFDEYMAFISSSKNLETVYLDQICVKGSDNSFVTAEKLLQSLQDLVRIDL